MCQTAFEHRERLTLSLSKKCQKCLEEQVMDGSLPCQKQKGYMNCSEVLCPRLYYFANWVAWTTNQKRRYPICPSFMEKSFLFQGQVKGQNLLRSNMIEVKFKMLVIWIVTSSIYQILNVFCAGWRPDVISCRSISSETTSWNVAN